MIQNWFLWCLPSTLRTKFTYDLQLDELAEKADCFLVKAERTFTPQVVLFREQHQHNHLGKSSDRPSLYNYSRG